MDATIFKLRRQISAMRASLDEMEKTLALKEGVVRVVKKAKKAKRKTAKAVKRAKAKPVAKTTAKKAARKGSSAPRRR